MLTTAIRQRVRDNLNRNDTGIDAKIQDWINDTKRRVEQRLNLDVMRKTGTLTATNAVPAPDFTTLVAGGRLKEFFLVRYRKTIPAAEEELSWTPIPRLSEAEVLRVADFVSVGVPVTGAPQGFTVTDTTIKVHPSPETGATYTLSLGWYEFSADWTFGGSEEPYIAKFGWQAVINGAAALGFAWLGQIQDSDRWEQKFESALREYNKNEMARALEGDITMRWHAGADERRPSAAFGLRS